MREIEFSLLWGLQRAIKEKSASNLKSNEYELFLPKACSPQSTSEEDHGYPVRIYYRFEKCIFFRNISI